MNKTIVIIIIVVLLLAILGIVGYIIYRRRKSSPSSPTSTSDGTLITGGKPSSAFDTNINLNESPPQYAPTNISKGGPQTNVPCPPCPDCKCPDCPACNCPVNDQKLKSSTEEITYLKWMVKFLGSIARRENAINRVIMKECPTTFSMVPMIQSSDQEFRLIKKDIGKDHDMLNYFNGNFTKLSGIPSTSYEEIL